MNQVFMQRKKKKHASSICDKDGKKLTAIRDVCARWKEYMEELYDKEDKPTDVCLFF